jgi:hypothetical protein
LMAYIPDKHPSFGFRYNKSSWNDLSDFTNNGATVSVVTNQLAFSAGAADYSQWINIPDGTCLERWSLTARLTVASIGTGLAIGQRSYYNTHFPRWLLAIFNTTTGFLTMGVDGNPSPVIIATSPGALSFSVTTDILEIVISMEGFNAKASIRNVTTSSAAISCNYTYTTNPGNNPFPLTMPNTGYMGIWNLGGSFNVASLQWNVFEPINAEMILVGDSLLKGYYCTGHGNRFGDLLNNYLTPTIIAAGGADTTDSLLVRRNEIIGLRPNKVGILIGAGDIAWGFSSATTIANYDNYVSGLLAAGIDVFHFVAVYIAALDQTPLINHILGTYPENKIINLYPPTHQAGTKIFDNTHWNDLGQLVALFTTLMSNKLQLKSYNEQNPIRNQASNTQSGSFNIDGVGIFNGWLAKIGVFAGVVPGARVHIGPALNAAGFGPLKVSDGPVLDNPEIGLFEYAASVMYFTPTATNRRPVSLAGRNMQSGTTYVVIPADQGKIIGLSNTGSRIVTLPAANSIPAGIITWFKDEAGTASSNDITINRVGGDTVDGSASTVINANYQTKGLYSDGASQWFSV